MLRPDGTPTDAYGLTRKAFRKEHEDSSFKRSFWPEHGEVCFPMPFGNGELIAVPENWGSVFDEARCTIGVFLKDEHTGRRFYEANPYPGLRKAYPYGKVFSPDHYICYDGNISKWSIGFGARCLGAVRRYHGDPNNAGILLAVAALLKNMEYDCLLDERFLWPLQDYFAGNKRFKFDYENMR